MQADPVKSYLLWRNAMAGRTDEFEARINKMWRRYKRDALTDGANVRKALLAQERRLLVQKGAKFIQPGMHTIAPFRNTVDRTLASWIDKEFRRLRLFPGKDKRRSIEVFNRLWDASKGGPKSIIEMSHDAARKGLIEASGPLSKHAAAAINKRAGRRLKANMRKAVDNAGRQLKGQQQSWADNIIRALEQAKHQAAMNFVDATSGLNPESAIHDAITKFKPPLGVLALSYLTHPRAAYRSTLAAGGEAAGAVDYMYYLPATARVAAEPHGFGAEHHAQIKSVRQWEALRRKRKQKRPGSFIFTTGFHVGDKGYLLPIPALLRDAAPEIERQERQKWVEALKEDAA